MKCKKCGHSAKTIGAMAAHYRRSHPGAMKPKGTRVKSRERQFAGDVAYDAVRVHEIKYHGK